MARTKRERERQATREQEKPRRATLQYDLARQTWLDEGDPFLVAEMTSVLNPQSWQVLLPSLRRQYLLDNGIHLIVFHCEARGQQWEGSLHDVLGRVFDELFKRFETEAGFDRHTLLKKATMGSLRVECLLSRRSVAEAQPPEQVSTEEGRGTTEGTVDGGTVDSPSAESANALTLANESKTGQDSTVLSPEETIKKLVAELIPTLPGAAEDRAKTIIGLENTLSQTLHAAFQGEAESLIKSLLEDIPADYEGKRHRATLINGLLTALDRGILIHDQQGRPHVCSMHPVRGRGEDAQGYLRLIERVASGPSRKSFPIPSFDQLQIIESSRQGRNGQGENVHSTLSI